MKVTTEVTWKGVIEDFLIKCAVALVVVLGILSLTGIFSPKSDAIKGASGFPVSLTGALSAYPQFEIKYCRVPFKEDEYNLFIYDKDGDKAVYSATADDIDFLKKSIDPDKLNYPKQKFTFPDWCYIVVPVVILLIPARRFRHIKRDHTAENKPNSN